MKRFYFLLLLFFPVLLYPQYTNVKINSSGTDHEEVAIAINPKNSSQMAAGANINYFYNSSNSGSAWSQKNMSSSLGVWGDPCLIYDGLNNLYYSHLSNPLVGYWIDRIVVQKSTDNGNTWNDGAGIGYRQPKNQDKEWMGVNLSDGPYKNHLYVAWTEFDSYGSSSSADSTRILFSRSTNLGANWMEPVVVSDRSGNCIDEDNTVEGVVPAPGPNGDIYLSWAGPLGLMFDKSTDGGVTFGRDVFVSTIPGGWDFAVPGIQRCNGMPITASDTSNSMYRGNIYIVWGDQRNGTSNSDVFFIKSTDRGVTWAGFKKVNNDNTDRHQFFPWMAIDQTTGFIYVVFYDRRATTGSATDVYVACSRDGGNTFENIKVSQSSFTPNQNVFFGDYTNIAACDRKIRPIWMRMDNSALSVWTVLMTDTTVSASVPVLLLPANNAINQPQSVACSWNQVIGASGYHMQVATDPGFNSTIFNDSLLINPSAQLSSLTNNIKYYWRVRAKIQTGFGNWSAVWNFSVGSNCVDVLTAAQWNLVSMPFVPSNPSVNVLFPSANSPAYSYNNGYQTVTQLAQGSGYWLKFPAAGTQTMCGQIAQTLTVPVAAGWNLIAPYHNQVAVSQLQTVPPGIINTSIYGYQGGYTITDALIPGKGYWLKSSQAGTLSFNATGKGNVSVVTGNLAWNTISLTDTEGKRAVLFVTDKTSEIDESFELPPVPPVDIFDARFAANMSAASLQTSPLIQLQGFKNPVTVQTNGIDINVLDPVTKKNLGKGYANQPLIITIENKGMLEISSEISPVGFQVMQNYPNPFNPSTTIGFILPQQGNVSLKVFNMLGEEIVTLFEGIKEAGEHEVEFDGKSLISGMYIYRLTFDNHTVAKRMALIK